MNPGPTGCSRRENFTLRETAIRGPRVPAPSAGCPAVQKTVVSKGRARPVPAAAVTPAARVVAVIIGFKGSVAGLLSLLGKSGDSIVRRSRDTGRLGTGRGGRYSRGRGEIS